MSMPHSLQYPQVAQLRGISADDRCLIAARLRDLSIPCKSSQEGNLRIELDSYEAMIQVQGVLQRYLAPHPVLVRWLEWCLQLE
jgi:hypothetical protein